MAAPGIVPLEHFVERYRQALAKAPNAWGQHTDDFGVYSHAILARAVAAGYSADAVLDAWKRGEAK